MKKYVPEATDPTPKRYLDQGRCMDPTPKKIISEKKTGMIR